MADDSNFPQPGQRFTWSLTPKGAQVAAQAQANKSSGASSFGLAPAAGEDDDAYARQYASDKAIY
jgi:hypothetical protein